MKKAAQSQVGAAQVLHPTTSRRAPSFQTVAWDPEDGVGGDMSDLHVAEHVDGGKPQRARQGQPILALGYEGGGFCDKSEPWRPKWGSGVIGVGMSCMRSRRMGVHSITYVRG
jgi:hypothetical protein